VVLEKKFCFGSIFRCIDVVAEIISLADDGWLPVVAWLFVSVAHAGVRYPWNLPVFSNEKLKLKK